MASTRPASRGTTWPMRLGAAMLLAATAVLNSRQSLAQRPDVPLQPSVASIDRLKSFGTMGKAVYPFTEGSKTEADLFRHEGKGCLTHMWFGGKWEDYEKMRIRVYVDGEKTASIDMELFLGHGIGYKDEAGQPSGIYNTYRILFP